MEKYVYDANGNMVERSDDSGEWTITWTPENQGQTMTTTTKSLTARQVSPVNS